MTGVLLPPSVSVDSTNGRQHRGALANAINGILRKLSRLTSADLTDYESGTWTPVDASGAGLTISTYQAEHSRTGNLAYANAYIEFPTTSNTAQTLIGGLPFAIPNRPSARGGSLAYASAASVFRLLGLQGSSAVRFYKADGAPATNADLSGATLYFNITYPIS